jgi:hypothetical protein
VESIESIHGGKNFSKDSGTPCSHMHLFDKTGLMLCLPLFNWKVLGTNYLNTVLEAVDPR